MELRGREGMRLLAGKVERTLSSNLFDINSQREHSKDRYRAVFALGNEYQRKKMHEQWQS